MRISVVFLVLSILASNLFAQLQLDLNLDKDYENSAESVYSAQLINGSLGEVGFTSGICEYAWTSFEGNFASGGKYISTDYVPGDQGTIAFCFYIDRLFNYQSLFDNSAGADNWECWVYSTGVIACRLNSSSSKLMYDLNREGATGKWHHFALTWKRRTDNPANADVEMYINGVRRVSLQNVFGTPGNILFGGGNNLNDYLEGKLDEIKIYDQVLTETQIGQIIPHPAKCPSPEDNSRIGQLTPLLAWQPSDIDSSSVYNLYLKHDGVESLLASNITQASYQFSDPMDLGVYEWRVDSVGSEMTEVGPWWSFEIIPIAYNPVPENDGHAFEDCTLSWSSCDLSSSYKIYFGTDPANLQFIANTDQSEYTLTNLVGSQKYYWRVDCVDQQGVVMGQGDIWSFSVYGSIARWSFEDTSNTAFDSTGNGHDGTIYNAMTTYGVLGDALHFDGLSSHVEIEPMNLNSNTITISAWIKADGLQVQWASVLYSRDASTSAGLALTSTNELAYTWNANPLTWQWHSGLFVPDNEWVFVALVVEPDKATIYLNDQQAVNFQPNAIEEFDGKTMIGWDVRNVSPARFFKGDIDELQIFNYSMTSDQINQLYSGVIPPHDPAVFDFEGSSLQGWRNVAVSEIESGPRVFSTVTSDEFLNVIPVSGSEFVAQRPSQACLEPHAPLVLRSPEFYLDSTDNWPIETQQLKVLLAGGKGSDTFFDNSFIDRTQSIAESGFLGIALRRVSDNQYVLWNGKQSDGDNFETVTFAKDQLAPFIIDTETYTLDLIDFCHGPWGWVAMDSVSIPGTLVDTFKYRPCDLNCDNKVDTRDLICLAGSWLRNEPAYDIFPFGGGDGWINNFDLANFAGVFAQAQQFEYIAHRGASYTAPENTLAAFNLAWECGADAIELDVHYSADKKVVVIHDFTTARVAPDSTSYTVAQTDSSVLRTLDVGSWKSPQYAGEKIPFLEEALLAIPQEKKALIEIKNGVGIENSIRDIAVTLNKLDCIEIIGFNFNQMVSAKQLMPEVPVYWLVGGTIPDDQLLECIEKADDAGLDGLDISYTLVNDWVVNELKRRGMGIYVWTIDDPGTASWLRDKQVDAIATNRPSWLKDQIQ